jgi:hypothetical protein
MVGKDFLKYCASLDKNSLKLTKETAYFMDELFEFLSGIFPSFFNTIKTQYDLDSMKFSWVILFFKIGLISEKGDLDFVRINNGLNNLYIHKENFMPSCPQFIDLCLKKHED